MASERLKTIDKSTELHYSTGSPLLLLAHALYFDTETDRFLAQMKWQNIDARTVNAFKVKLIGCDAFGEVLGSIEYQYDGISARPGEQCGDRKAIPFRSAHIHRYHVMVCAVSFSDGSIWNADHEEIFEPLPQGRTLTMDKELLGQYKRDLEQLGCPRAVHFEPRSVKGIWQCGCGSWQKEGMPCLRCGAKQEALEKALDPERIKAHLEEYTLFTERQALEAQEKRAAEKKAREKQEEERKRQEEEKRRRDAEREALIRARKRRRKTFAAVVFCLAAIAVGGYFAAINYFLPEQKHDKAVSLIRSGNYDAAIEILKSLDGYGDSAEQIKNAEYQKGWSLLDRGLYEEAAKQFGSLAGYKDSALRAKEALYKKAVSLLEQEQFAEAVRQFEALEGYSDSASRILQATADSLYKEGKIAEASGVYAQLDEQYQTHRQAYAASYEEALRLIVAENYPEAYNAFLSLGEYRDAAEMAKESLYLSAIEKSEKDDPAEAAKLFSEIKEYKDSRERLRRIGMEMAEKDAVSAIAILASALETDEYRAELYGMAKRLEEEENFEAAIQAYVSLGNYNDSVMKSVMLTYKYGEQLTAGGEYQKSAAVFDSMEGFSDSAVKADEARYLYAKTLMENGSYEEAAEAFTAISAYKDSADQVKAAKYKAAEALMADGEYPEASKRFGALGAYDNASGMANECLYLLAKAEMDHQNYESAYAGFDSLKNYKDSASLARECRYQQAVQLKTAGKYADAEAVFKGLGKYGDSVEQAIDCRYQRALELAKNADWLSAIHLLDLNGEDRDSLDLRNECRYQYALVRCNEKEYQSAYNEYLLAGEYSDSPLKAQEAAYLLALQKQEEKQYLEAAEWFAKAKGYRDSEDSLLSTGEYFLTAQDYAAAETVFGLLEENEGARNYLYEIGNYYVLAGKYRDALRVFRAVGEYRDAAQKAEELPAQIAEEHYNNGEWADALEWYEKLADSEAYKEHAEVCREEIHKQKRAARRAEFVTGKYVVFGSYEQDGNKANGKEPIEWYVLVLGNNKTCALLISRYILDKQPYSQASGSSGWMSSYIREWLNSAFLTEAFTEDERKALRDDCLQAGGKSAGDRVFLLSSSEVEEYLPTRESREAYITPYARSLDGYSGWWRVRDLKSNQSAYEFDSSGKKDTGPVDNIIGIRPTIWLDLESEYY